MAEQEDRTLNPDPVAAIASGDDARAVGVPGEREDETVVATEEAAGLELQAVVDRIDELAGDEVAIRELEASLIPDPDTSSRPQDPAQPDEQVPASGERVTLQPRATPQRILARAATQIGYREGPHDESKFGDWYGMPNNPWCAMFVSWVFHLEGMPLKASTAKGFASCSLGRNWFRANGRLATTPKPGHIVFFDWTLPAREPLDHVGIVEKVNVDGSIGTIEGNTIDPVNGGPQGVFRRTRRAGIVAYGVPNFQTPPPPPPDFATELPLLKRGARGDAVRRLQGLIRAAMPGLKDATLSLGGDFGPVTERFVRQLQKEAELEPDGEVGRQTWRMLLGIAPGGGLPTLSRGSEGPAARRVQGLLRAGDTTLKDWHLSLGGSFGPVTEELVRKREEAAHLPVNGVVEAKTWRLLLGLRTD